MPTLSNVLPNVLALSVADAERILIGSAETDADAVSVASPSMNVSAVTEADTERSHTASTMVPTYPSAT